VFGPVCACFLKQKFDLAKLSFRNAAKLWFHAQSSRLRTERRVLQRSRATASARRFQGNRPKHGNTLSALTSIGVGQWGLGQASNATNRKEK
jgi:hypothetical protein